VAIEKLETVSARRLDMIVESRCKYQVKEVIHHLREQSSNVFVWHSQIRVSVHLDEPDTEVLINQEVKAKQLEAVLALVWVQLLPRRLVHIKHEVLYPLQEMLLHVQLMLWIYLIQILLKSFKSHSVAVLVFPVILPVLLQTVVRKMHIVVLVAEGVIVRAGAQVALVVAVELHLVGGHRPHTYVELATLKQHGLLDVLLDDPVRVEGAT
jgi:hypothetical protein